MRTVHLMTAGLLAVMLGLLLAGGAAWGQAEAARSSAGEGQTKHGADPYSGCSSASGRFHRAEVGVVDCAQRVIWAAQDNGSDLDWNQANAWCGSLGGGWQLPSVAQLQSLYDDSKPWVDNVGKPATDLIRLSRSAFWSAERDGSTEAWYVSLRQGQQRSTDLSYSTNERALCVRVS